MVVKDSTCPRSILEELERTLLTFGSVVSYDNFTLIEDVAIVYEVTYEWATQAFLAAIALDGKPVGSSTLEVNIKECAKEREMLNNLSKQLQKYIGPVYFPFKGID